MQESKATARQVDGFRFTAKCAGYNITATEAEGPASGRSAGVMICWRRHLAVSEDNTVPNGPRSVSLKFTSKHLGELILASIYLHQGDSLAGDSPAASLLYRVLEPLVASGSRAIIGGDFNQAPQKLQDWLARNHLPFVVMCQEAPTFLAQRGSSNIDYFVVTRELAFLLWKPEIVVLSGLAGHRPVRTGWDHERLNRHVQVWRRPPRPATQPVFGPLPDHSQFDSTPHRLTKYQSSYPRDGESYNTAGRYTDNMQQHVVTEIQAWVSKVFPFLQGVVGMERQPLQPYKLQRLPLKKALRISDKAVQSPRARIALSHYVINVVACVAQGLPVPAIPPQEGEKLTSS